MIDCSVCDELTALTALIERVISIPTLMNHSGLKEEQSADCIYASPPLSSLGLASWGLTLVVLILYQMCPLFFLQTAVGEFKQRGYLLNPTEQDIL